MNLLRRCSYSLKKDLNYRIDLPDPEVRELIGDNLLPHNRDALLEYDQVRRVTVNRPHLILNLAEHVD